MAPQDATMFWLSARTRNDLFLLYSFADTGVSTETLRTAVAARSARIPDLRVRLRETPGDLGYPSWVPCEYSASQFIEHPLPRADWAAVQAALGDLLATGVDATSHPWKLHVFRGVAGAPMRASDDELATVVVLQMSHALADGMRAAAVARELFSGEDMVGGAGRPSASGAASGGQATGRAVDNGAGSRARAAEGFAAELGAGRGADRAADGDLFGIIAESFARLRDSGIAGAAWGAARLPAGMVRTAVRGFRAYRAQTELAELTAAGTVPQPGPGFAPSAVNKIGAAGIIDHRARMIVCDAEELRVQGWTITVVVLTAVSVALAEYLAAQGEPVSRLGAQVPMALSGESVSRNHYRSLGVELCTDEPDLRLRADRIAAALAERRLRAQHPLLSAQDRVTAVTPARILRRDVDRYPVDSVPDSIAGHTVVSSVYRGPADLTFGGGPVRCTGGFPALGAVMHLTHGVHGLGDTVTVSIHADAAVVDVDSYAGLLRTALREVAARLAAR
ncbi:wax ester/triacylglycerol synthase domain-containing protein [Nocardia sp. NPDC050713]|uniref:wax ester/triacylglycerol synthase domain-containing protein n=1 Tax=Nocardia sp. NPDC050713 TaxID=3154511 RepID=UPI0033D15235